MEAVAIVKGGEVRTRTVDEFVRHRPPPDLLMSRYAMGRWLVIALAEGGEMAAAGVLRGATGAPGAHDQTPDVPGFDPRDRAPIHTLARRIVRISEPPVEAITAAEAQPWHALASSWPEIKRLAAGISDEAVRRSRAEIKRRMEAE